MQIKVRNSGLGIGDQVCGLYVCQAYKNLYPKKEIIYYSRHHQWLGDATDITVRPYHEYVGNPPARLDMYLDATSDSYVRQLPKTRKQIYAERLEENLLPSPPSLKTRERKVTHDVILFPFAAWKYREWPLGNWLKLEQLLNSFGYQTLILATADKAEQVARFRGKKEIGLSPDQVISRIHETKCVVSNDSGMAHLAGMYNIPVISVISAQFSGHHLFCGTSNETISDSTLGKISPERVSSAVVHKLSKTTVQGDRKVVIRAGDFGLGSHGGIYNSCIFRWKNESYLLCRVEEQTEFQRIHGSTATPYLAKLNSQYDIEWFKPLRFQGFPIRSRIEDFRVFSFHGKLMVSHPLIPYQGGGTHQVVSALDIENFTITLTEQPVVSVMDRIEKNWVFFQHKKMLTIIYSCNPFRVFVRSEIGYVSFLNLKIDIPWSKDLLVSNSTNLVSFDSQHHLLFIHVRDKLGVYHHGAILIDKESLVPKYVSRAPIYHSNNAEGLRKGVIYFMGAIEVGNEILVSMGEGDLHTSIRYFSKVVIRKDLIPVQ